MDWKKEIKLSDLVPRRRRAAGDATAAAAAPSGRARRKRPERRASVPKELVGLKIGTSQLAAARVSNNGSARLVALARTPLSPGVVAGGEIRDRSALALALNDFFEHSGLPRDSVRLGLATNRIGVRVLEISGIEDDAQLDNAIRFRAQETLPIPLDAAALDYHVVKDTRDDAGVRTCRVVLVVAHRDLIDAYVAACEEAGIDLVGIDLEAFALLRALAPESAHAPDGTPAALVAVAVGHERSTLAVSDGRSCEFTRVLAWGGAALDRAIADALGVPPAEAERIKRELSLAHDDAATPGLSGDRAQKARDAVRRQLSTFAREVVSSLQFYQSQPASLPLAEIVLTGGTAAMAGLAAEVEALLGVHVRVGDPLVHVAAEAPIENRDELGSLTVAIGLGIES